MVRLTRSLCPVAQLAVRHEHNGREPAELARLFGIRLARKRRAIESVLDREILRLRRLRRLFERADAEVVLAALDYLGSTEDAVKWLSSPQASLGKAIPLFKANSEKGKAEVIEILMGLDP